MARLLDAKCRQCRREGCKLFLKGEKCTTKKCPIERRPYIPGQHGQGRKRTTQYGTQLREKQKAKYTYGVLEKQFRNLFEKASRTKGIKGQVLLQLFQNLSL